MLPLVPSIPSLPFIPLEPGLPEKFALNLLIVGNRNIEFRAQVRMARHGDRDMRDLAIADPRIARQLDAAFLIRCDDAWRNRQVVPHDFSFTLPLGHQTVPSGCVNCTTSDKLLAGSDRGTIRRLACIEETGVSLGKSSSPLHLYGGAAAEQKQRGGEGQRRDHPRQVRSAEIGEFQSGGEKRLFI